MFHVKQHPRGCSGARLARHSGAGRPITAHGLPTANVRRSPQIGCSDCPTGVPWAADQAMTAIVVECGYVISGGADGYSFPQGTSLSCAESVECGSNLIGVPRSLRRIWGDQMCPGRRAMGQANGIHESHQRFT